MRQTKEQGDIGKDRPVACASSSFGKAEKSYTERESAPIVWELSILGRICMVGGSR
jgi:hypothetical protein